MSATKQSPGPLAVAAIGERGQAAIRSNIAGRPGEFEEIYVAGIEIIRFKSDVSERARAILNLGEMRRAAVAKAEGIL